MEFLKDYFGEESLSYDQLVEKLTEANIEIKVDDGEISIPKSRFDQVIKQRDEAKSELSELQDQHFTDEQKREKADLERQEKYDKMQKELTEVKVKEIFLSNEIDTESIGSWMETLDLSNMETATERASKIVDNLKTERVKLQKKYDIQSLDETLKPDDPHNKSNVITVEQFRDMNIQDRAKLFTENEQLHNKLVEQSTVYSK